MKSKNNKVKKPFYKKWWVWAIVAAVGISFIFGGGSSKDKEDDPMEPNQVQTGEVDPQEKHIHNWADATCTEAKTCTSCGAVNGEALGHDWLDATCTESKTCTRCGATDGDPLGHDMRPATEEAPSTCSRCGYTEGKPLKPAEDPDKTSIQDTEQQPPSNPSGDNHMVWIPTNGGTKYHSNKYCSNMENPIQVTEEEAIARGYTACKRCYG